MPTIKGKLIDVYAEKKIEGQGKNHTLQGFSIALDNNYDDKMYLEAWNDTADVLDFLQKGDELEITFKVTSRLYEGKWYTNYPIAKSIVKIKD